MLDYDNYDDVFSLQSPKDIEVLVMDQGEVKGSSESFVKDPFLTQLEKLITDVEV